MKKILPPLVLLCAVAFVAVSLLPPRNRGPFDVVGFGRLPVLVNGRLKPFDTVARTALLMICNATANSPDSTSIVTPDFRKPDATEAIRRMFGGGTAVKGELTPTAWLLDVMFRPEAADTYRVFVVDNFDLLTLLNLKREDGLDRRRFAFSEFEAALPELERQEKLAEPVETSQRSAFQRSVIQMYENVILYERLQHSLVPPGATDFLGDLLNFQKSLPAGAAALRAKEAKQPYDEAAAKQMTDLGEQFMTMERFAYLLAVPPAADAKSPTDWRTTGSALLETFGTGRIDPAVLTYAAFAQTWRQDQPEQFNKLVGLYHDELAKRFAPVLEKCQVEARFNAAAPFYRSETLYVAAFFAAVFAWMVWPRELGRVAFFLVAVAWLATTAGILTRMWLEGRPPVTNLYSSALFVGWGAVALCLGLEAIYQNAVGSAAAGMVGFTTLLIADHLAQSGDTLEMMRAVLDSNFWLATHVVVVASGYAATFLAGFLAIIYIFRGLFTRSLDKPTADALARMVYGIVCFATLFSLVGTILGGIWADQSWGRFWGWDPKENGALIIVIWNAIILHARWGGMVRQRGLMCLAVFGNVVTSWSWFGVNMLGVGLHSYGFMDAAFWWLIVFVASQLLIIALANLPLARWRSFRRAAIAAPATVARPAAL